MTPEDVKISLAVPWPVQPGIIIPKQYIPAHEVGAILREVIAMTALAYNTERILPEVSAARFEMVKAWLAKADELEKMK